MDNYFKVLDLNTNVPTSMQVRSAYNNICKQIAQEIMKANNDVALTTIKLKWRKVYLAYKVLNNAKGRDAYFKYIMASLNGNDNGLKTLANCVDNNEYEFEWNRKFKEELNSVSFNDASVVKKANNESNDNKNEELANGEEANDKNESENVRVDDIDDDDEAKRTSAKGVTYIKEHPVRTIVALAMVGAIALGVASCTKNKGKGKNVATSSVVAMETLTPTEQVVATATPEATPMAIDINDEVLANQKAQEIYDKIAQVKLTNGSYAADINSVEDVKALIDWARHSYTDYNGSYDLSNVEASSIIAAYYIDSNKSDVDTNMSELLYFSKEDQALIKKVEDATNAIDQNNNSLDDENNAYAVLNEALDNGGLNNVTVAIILEAASNCVDDLSMQEARGTNLKTGVIDKNNANYKIYTRLMGDNTAFNDIFSKALAEDDQVLKR